MYAVSGAALAVPGMALCKRARRFSCVGVSIAGGVLHNLGQLGAAVIVAQTPGLSAYLPVLLVAGAVTGLVNGLLADVLIKRFP